MIKLDAEEQEQLEQMMAMSKNEFNHIVREMGYCQADITALYKRVKNLEEALLTACEYRNDCCPIGELMLTGDNPEWCEITGNMYDGVDSCRHYDESTAECWKKYYLGELEMGDDK